MKKVNEVTIVKAPEGVKKKVNADILLSMSQSEVDKMACESLRALKERMEDNGAYCQSVLEQRVLYKKNKPSGSFYKMSTEDLWSKLLKASYKISLIEEETGKVLFETEDPELEGFFGMKKFNDILNSEEKKEKINFYGVNPKYTPDSEKPAKTEIGYIPENIEKEIKKTNVTTIVTLLHMKENFRFAVTFFPDIKGLEVTPSLVEWETLKHGKQLTETEVSKLGFDWIKIIHEVPEPLVF